MLADLGLSAGSGFGFTLNPKIPNPLNPLGEFDGQLPSDSRWLGFVAKVKALSQRSSQTSCNCDLGQVNAVEEGQDCKRGPLGDSLGGDLAAAASEGLQASSKDPIP